MQDAHTVLDDFSACCTSLADNTWVEVVMCGFTSSCACLLRSQLSYYGVFDGHAGHRASQFTAQHLHKIIADKLPKGVIMKTLVLCAHLHKHNVIDCVIRWLIVWSDGWLCNQLIVYDWFCEQLVVDHDWLCDKVGLFCEWLMVLLLSEHRNAYIIRRFLWSWFYC